MNAGDTATLATHEQELRRGNPTLFAGTGAEPGWYQGVAVVLIWAVTAWDQLATVKAYRAARSLRPAERR
ncbi:hypothetical protein [Arthrobacter sp.]|uniref:hypothetical protein n=1 Tax=Arthrobacter sp. TaxID=1667 RepID=UPI003393C0FF